MPNHNRVFPRQVVFNGNQNTASILLSQKSCKVEVGANTPGRETAGSVTVAQVKEIAEAKMKDLNANDIDAAMQIILGSARSMGIEVQ